jgi:ssDNA-binding protein
VPLALKKLAAQFVPGQAEPDPKTKDDGIKLAFYNGSIKDYDGFEGMLAVPAHEYESRPKPAIANRKGVSVAPGEEQYPYSGCEGILSVTLWGQLNKNGKRVGINLRGVQFVADGEPFAGGGEHSAEEEFEALGDEAAAAGAGGDDLGFD